VINTRLQVAYDGTGFNGWAQQPDARTIEHELTRAIDRLHDARGDVVVAGRTDAGVHATGQVVSVLRQGGPPTAALPRALNDILPTDIVVTAADEVPADFSARFSARSRSYTYDVRLGQLRDPLQCRRELHEPRTLDRSVLDTLAATIVGEHDFRAFTPAETEHKTFTRTVQTARWVDTESGIRFEITANAFLRHMVRTLVGTMIVTARGDRGNAPEQFPGLLTGALRSEAGWTAPAHALCLVHVDYVNGTGSDPRRSRNG
jgi:tRNA pseudouridine38-40 synthase